MSILLCMRDRNGNCRENGLTMERNHIVRPFFGYFMSSASAAVLRDQIRFPDSLHTKSKRGGA